MLFSILRVDNLSIFAADVKNDSKKLKLCFLLLFGFFWGPSLTKFDADDSMTVIAKVLLAEVIQYAPRIFCFWSAQWSHRDTCQQHFLINLIIEISLKFEVSPFPQWCFNQDKIFQGYADLPLFLSTLGFCVSSWLSGRRFFYRVFKLWVVNASNWFLRCYFKLFLKWRAVIKIF